VPAPNRETAQALQSEATRVFNYPTENAAKLLVEEFGCRLLDRVSARSDQCSKRNRRIRAAMDKAGRVESKFRMAIGATNIKRTHVKRRVIQYWHEQALECEKRSKP